MTDTEVPTRAPDPTLLQLVDRLGDQTRTLVRDEVELARTEIGDSVRHAGIGAGLFGGAGLLGFLGLATLVAAAVAGLAEALAPWLAALVVAAALFAAAGVAALVGKKQVGAVGVPERTVSTVRTDIAEIKESRR